jgi:hypothetical protein
MRNHRLLLLGVALGLAAVPCLATPITFAGFVNSGSQDLTVTYSAVGPTNIMNVAGKPITFYYQNLNGVPVALQGNLAATLNFHATTTDIVTALAGGYDYQLDYSGNFTITFNNHYGAYAPGTYVLLAGTFGSSSSVLAGTIGNFTLSDATPPPGEVVFNSDSSFLPVTGAGDQSFTLDLINVTNLACNTNHMFSGFNAAEGGTFSANIVPEPFSFLLLGSGPVGLGLLRRKLR